MSEDLMKKTFAELGITSIYGFGSRKEGMTIKAIGIKDGILVKEKIERTKFIPKGDGHEM